MRQAIIWTNDVPGCRRIYASHGLNGSIDFTKNMRDIFRFTSVLLNQKPQCVWSIRNLYYSDQKLGSSHISNKRTSTKTQCTETHIGNSQDYVLCILRAKFGNYHRRQAEHGFLVSILFIKRKNTKKPCQTLHFNIESSNWWSQLKELGVCSRDEN